MTIVGVSSCSVNYQGHPHVISTPLKAMLSIEPLQEDATQA
jgi:hypothetical protein